MDRQSLTKQIMEFILAKNQKVISVHGKFWWGKKKPSFYFIIISAAVSNPLGCRLIG